MFKMEVKGFDELQKNLKKLEERVKSLDGEHTVPLTEILADSFMAKNTNFSSIDAFFSAGGFRVKSNADLDVIQEDKLDVFVRSVSKFESWKAMCSEGAKEWAAKKLGF